MNRQCHHVVVDTINPWHRAGLLDDNGALQNFLVDCFQALLCRHRVLSSASRQFYTTVIRSGGHMLHDWVSKLFHGPSASTTHRHTAQFDYPYMLGINDKFFDVVATLLDRWGLAKAPCIISEDGTALQMRLDITFRDGLIFVFGLSGGSFTVATVADLQAAAKERPLASILYAYSLVPLVRGSPHFPLFAFSHDNSNTTFTPKTARDIWKYMWQVSIMKHSLGSLRAYHTNPMHVGLRPTEYQGHRPHPRRRQEAGQPWPPSVKVRGVTQ